MRRDRNWARRSRAPGDRPGDFRHSAAHAVLKLRDLGLQTCRQQHHRRRHILRDREVAADLAEPFRRDNECDGMFARVSSPRRVRGFAFGSGVRGLYPPPTCARRFRPSPALCAGSVRSPPDLHPARRRRCHGPLRQTTTETNALGFCKDELRGLLTQLTLGRFDHRFHQRRLLWHCRISLCGWGRHL